MERTARIRDENRKRSNKIKKRFVTEAKKKESNSEEKREITDDGPKSESER